METYRYAPNEHLAKRIELSGYATEIDRWAEDMEGRFLRPSTIDGRVKNLVRVLDIAKGVTDKRASELTPNDFRAIRRGMAVSDPTIRQYLIALGDFVASMTGRDPYKEARMAWSSPAPIRTFIGLDEWNEVLRAATDPTDRVYVMLASTAGLRASEITGMELDDIHECRDGTHLTVRGKGRGEGKVCDIRLCARMESELRIYMERRAELLERTGDRSGGRLLVKFWGDEGSPVSKYVMRDRIRKLSERMGVPFSSHTFRRFYCMSLYESGADLLTIKTLMRHSKVRTTIECYMEADPGRIRGAEDALDAFLARGERPPTLRKV